MKERAEKLRQCSAMRIELEDIQDCEHMIKVAIDYSFLTTEELEREIDWLDEVLGK